MVGEIHVSFQEIFVLSLPEKTFMVEWINENNKDSRSRMKIKNSICKF